MEVVRLQSRILGRKDKVRVVGSCGLSNSLAEGQIKKCEMFRWVKILLCRRQSYRCNKTARSAAVVFQTSSGQGNERLRSTQYKMFQKNNAMYQTKC